MQRSCRSSRLRSRPRSCSRPRKGRWWATCQRCAPEPGRSCRHIRRHRRCPGVVRNCQPGADQSRPRDHLRDDHCRRDPDSLLRQALDPWVLLCELRVLGLAGVAPYWRATRPESREGVQLESCHRDSPPLGCGRSKQAPHPLHLGQRVLLPGHCDLGLRRKSLWRRGLGDETRRDLSRQGVHCNRDRGWQFPRGEDLRRPDRDGNFRAPTEAAKPSRSGSRGPTIP